jgi:uncharacterized protein (DUF1697 family)
MTTFVALLRGINVGGPKRVGMTDLADFFQSPGFTSVRTCLQSGNVVFESPDGDPSRLSGMAGANIFR